MIESSSDLQPGDNVAILTRALRPSRKRGIYIGRFSAYLARVETAPGRRAAIEVDRLEKIER